MNVAEDIKPEWIRREEAASILGCSYRTIVNLTDAGKLHAKRSAEGVVLLDKREVVDFGKTYVPLLGRPRKDPALLRAIPTAQGHREARIIELLRKGQEPADIVVLLHCTLNEVHEVYNAMRADWGALETASQKKERLRKERAAMRDKSDQVKITIANLEAEAARGGKKR